MSLRYETASCLLAPLIQSLSFERLSTFPYVIGHLSGLAVPATRKLSCGPITWELNRIGHFFRSLGQLPLLKFILPWRIITLSLVGVARFELSVEQRSHDKEREKSESSKNAANDRTRIV